MLQIEDGLVSIILVIHLSHRTKVNYSVVHSVDMYHKKLFKCDCYEQFTSVEKMRDYILNILLKDNNLYNKMEEWLNEHN